ncbi:Fur family transcriptional regulator [Roseomonas eburnea]|uniref:Fur family transcriptional regulator n=1 Tax=Neoroseomonas eburnea TaxID=1346889 RepID=A0A9X9XDG9_9PROT|nr:transcriptional repressor [Neoroseomonas eburnea]MBR0681755.1 Fur family transcriptional regulator [Neoroseomonas eburnea]
MASTADAAARGEVRRAGLAADGPLPRLLTLLRTAEETHVDAAGAQRLAVAGGLALGRAEVADLLEALAGKGLLGRVPSMGGGAVYDTVPHPHSHLVDEATDTVVDLDVSPETLSAIIRQAIADQPGRVEVLLRIRAPAGETAPARRGRPRRAPGR